MVYQRFVVMVITSHNNKITTRITRITLNCGGEIDYLFRYSSMLSSNLSSNVCSFNIIIFKIHLC